MPTRKKYRRKKRKTRRKTRRKRTRHRRRRRTRKKKGGVVAELQILDDPRRWTSQRQRAQEGLAQGRRRARGRHDAQYWQRESQKNMFSKKRNKYREVEQLIYQFLNVLGFNYKERIFT